MANNKSAKKRILIAKRNRLQNRFYITSIRTLTKLFLKNLEIYKESKTVEDKAKVQSISRTRCTSFCVVLCRYVKKVGN